jgi:hypothetical integral membrane protein (TIGR02206 family)
MPLGTFKLFGISHLVVLGIMFLGAGWISMTQSPTLARRQRQGIAAGLGLQILLFHAYHLISGRYDLARYLPFHLCSLSAVMVLLSLVINRPVLANITIYWAPIAALITVVLPDVGPQENFPTFRFLEFFSSHVLIVWGCVWMLTRLPLQLTWRSMAVAYGTLFAGLPAVWLINRLTQGNYMYMHQKPPGGQMDFLGPAPSHFVGLIALVLGVFILEMWGFKWLQHKLMAQQAHGSGSHGSASHGSASHGSGSQGQ